MALSSLVLGLAAAFAPATVVLWLVVGVVLSAATLIAGGSLRTAGWLAATTAVATVVAAALNLPWTTTWSWSGLVGPPINGPHGDGLVDLASLALDGREFAVLAVALYIPVVVALAISRAWRLTWAIRGAALVLVFGALTVLADRDALPFDVPEKGMTLVPVALGIALACASVTGAIGADVRGRGFGWRQPVAVLGNVAIVIGIVPALTSIGDGAWDAPRTPLPALLAAQLPLDPPDGDYRVLYIGDPRVLPVPAHEYRDGIAFAVVDDGPLEFTERWTPPETDADQIVVDALDRIADGSTLRAGALFAPTGIRFIVLPEIDGAQSTVDDPVAAPAGLVEALSEQLDISATYGPPTIRVFAIGPWIPASAQLTGATADASRLAGDDVLVRADLTERTPLFVGSDPSEGATADVVAGVVHVAAPFDDAHPASYRRRRDRAAAGIRCDDGVRHRPARHGHARATASRRRGCCGWRFRPRCGWRSSSSPAGPVRRSGVDAANCCPTRRSSISTSCRRLPFLLASRARCSAAASPGDPIRNLHPTNQGPTNPAVPVELDVFATGPPLPIDAADDDAELGRSLDELAGPS